MANTSHINAGKPRPTKPQPLDAINYPDAQLKVDVVVALTGIGRSTWYRMIAENEAPKPLRFGQRCSRWRAADIKAFLAKRAQQGGA